MKTLIALALLGAAGASAAASTCTAASAATAPTLVELYTSEGCSSCPPADRWLSTLKGRSDVLALAFHVNYWDKLGWVDRFATPESTARQYTLSRWNGSASVYTPQIVVNGRDSRAGVALPKAGASSVVAVALQREGDVVTAQIAAAPTAPARLDGYWAVLEDSHQSKVRSGENAGETLDHDHVVRLYQPVAAWAAAEGTRAQLTVSRGAPGNPRRVVFVVTDAATHKPLQALALGC
jgi:hypothetical protein